MLTKQELAELVERIMKHKGTEDEVNGWLRLLEENVPHPEVSGLIFWPDMYGLGNNPSAQEIIEKALHYKPIQL